MKIILNPTKLLLSLLITLLCTTITLLVPPASPASPASLPSGTQISLNGQPWAAAWSQWQVDTKGKVYIGITDAGITQLLGVELLDTEDVAKQPVKWLSQPTPKPLVLNTWLNQGYRYLDVTELAQKAGWQLKILGNTLSINTSAAKVEAIYPQRQPGSDRLQVDLDRPTPDLIPDALVERNILWAPGLRWRQQHIDLGASHFPVVWLEIDLRTPGLILKPIWSDPNTLIGTAPLIQTAQRYGAAAAINGGFFNRRDRLPLGAIRRDGRWLSSPILNRGAIAWNELGQVKISHLSLPETLTTSQKELLPVVAFNSGYVQAGITCYTSDWGTTYTPLNDNEIIVVVQNHQVTAQLSGGDAGKTAFSILSDGYLLVIRDDSAAANSLPIGTIISLDASVPSDFAHYPQILGAGPLLVQNHQIVLNAKAEKFSAAFIIETAPRSAIGTTTAGTLLMVAVHNRGGTPTGPTLEELAEIMQQMGCVDALNLDGGSSTSLYLGGQLLDRAPTTAARVHNGLGVFLEGVGSRK